MLRLTGRSLVDLILANLAGAALLLPLMLAHLSPRPSKTWLDDPSAILPVAVCSSAGFLVVVVWRWRSSEGRGLTLPSFLGDEPRRVVSMAALGAAMVILFSFGFAVAVERIFGRAALETSLSKFLTSWGKLPPGVQVTVAADIGLLGPIAEELFFRGLVFQSFRAAGHAGWGAVISAALFALAHGELVQLVPLFVFGLVMAWLYARTRSLAAPILAHILNNTMVVLASLDFTKHL